MRVFLKLRAGLARGNIKARKTPRYGERGNVLFYILIAVALIAALSYAVSSTGRGGSTDISAERASLAASEILEYANVLSSATTQLKLRGCRDIEVSFDNTISGTDYSNTNAPADNTCNVFHLAGGGVQYIDPEAEWLDNDFNAEDYFGETLITATACVDQIGSGTADCAAAGSGAAELIAVTGFIKEEICISLNRKLGVGTAGAAPPVDDGSAWPTSSTAYQGNYTGGTRIQDSGQILDGRKAACFEATTNPAGGFHFYKVLLAR